MKRFQQVYAKGKYFLNKATNIQNGVDISMHIL